MNKTIDPNLQQTQSLKLLNEQDCYQMIELAQRNIIEQLNKQLYSYKLEIKNLQEQFETSKTNMNLIADNYHNNINEMKTIQDRLNENNQQYQSIQQNYQIIHQLIDGKIQSTTEEKTKNQFNEFYQSLKRYYLIIYKIIINSKLDRLDKPSSYFEYTVRRLQSLENHVTHLHHKWDQRQDDYFQAKLIIELITQNVKIVIFHIKQKDLSDMLAKSVDKQLQSFLNLKVYPFQQMIEKRTNSINIAQISLIEKVESISKELLSLDRKFKEKSKIENSRHQNPPVIEIKQPSEDYEQLKEQIKMIQAQVEQINQSIEIKIKDTNDQFEYLNSKQIQSLEIKLKSNLKKIRQEFQEDNQDIKLQLIKTSEDFIELIDEKIQSLKLDSFRFDVKENLSTLYKDLDNIQQTLIQKNEQQKESLEKNQKQSSDKDFQKKLWLDTNQLVVQNQSSGQRSEKSRRGINRAFKLRRTMNYSFQEYSLSELQEQLLNLSKANYPLVKSREGKQSNK